MVVGGLVLMVVSAGPALPFQRRGGEQTGFVRWQFEQAPPAKAQTPDATKRGPVRVEVECSVWNTAGKRQQGLMAKDERLSCKVSATMVTEMPAMGSWPQWCAVSFDSLRVMFEPAKGSLEWVATLESTTGEWSAVASDTTIAHLRLIPPESGADWQFSMDMKVTPARPYPAGSIGEAVVKSAELWTANNQRFVETREASRSSCVGQAVPEFPSLGSSPLLPSQLDRPTPKR